MEELSHPPPPRSPHFKRSLQSNFTVEHLDTFLVNFTQSHAGPLKAASQVITWLFAQRFPGFVAAVSKRYSFAGAVLVHNAFFSLPPASSGDNSRMALWGDLLILMHLALKSKQQRQERVLEGGW